MHEAHFKLKQHTPLIHFLHEQPGATLRATELKPKLDRFILSRLGAALPEAWIARKDDKDHVALDYKMQIERIGFSEAAVLAVIQVPDQETGAPKWQNSHPFPQLLANMGGKEHLEDLKNLVLSKGAQIRIFSWHKDLLQHLRQNLPKLIALENFGNRPNKGFGSFTCTHVDNEPVDEVPPFRYWFDWETHGNTEIDRQRNLFVAITTFYKCLRSGINLLNRDRNPVFYFKSLMYAYAESKRESWDKRSIKRKYLDRENFTTAQPDYRDWLGLSTEEQWGRRFKITKTPEAPVERFPSPLFFKPVHRQDNTYRVFFTVKKFEQHTFDTFKATTIEVKKDGTGNLKLKPTDQFDFDDYLDFVFRRVDLDNHIETYDTKNLNCIEHQIYTETIRPIFESIKRNLRQ